MGDRRMDDEADGPGEAGKDLVRRWQQAYNTGQLDELDSLLDPAWTSNNFLPGVPQSIESAKLVHRAILEVLPDLQYETIRMVAEADVVVQQYRARGTHLGEYQGLAPTGRRVEWGGVNMLRIRGGRIVEHCGYADDLGVLVQLGAPLPEGWVALRHH